MTMRIVKAEWDTGPIERKVEGKSQDVLRDTGEYILDEARDTTPKDMGDLAASAELSVDKDGNLAIGYSASYAVIQHENLSYKHQGSGRAKWFELTLQEKVRGIFDKIAQGMKL